MIDKVKFCPGVKKGQGGAVSLGDPWTLGRAVSEQWWEQEQDCSVKRHEEECRRLNP